MEYIILKDTIVKERQTDTETKTETETETETEKKTVSERKKYCLQIFFLNYF